MALYPYTELLRYAIEHKFTVGAFNSLNMETLQAIVGAAEKKNVPLIVQTYHAHMEYAGPGYMSAICEVAARNSSVKIALGLDHGRTYEQAKRCIDSGYSGVMIDLSSEDYGYNVAETRKVVELAHSKGVSVEAELGKILDADQPLSAIASNYTDPDVARKFVKETGIDCLAVSIGTAHGFYKHKPVINLDLLKELVDTVPCPIVVHGGSNTPDEDILSIVRTGVAKLNVGTDFFAAYTQALHDFMQEHGTKCDIMKLMEAARSAVEKIACDKIDLLTKFMV
ncbi:MAG: class II fructose-bisphosphate aldolase family protein [Synergistaceae bacterium]|jgi:ketose-bisphosphate aldolase|nr:class II fructose-bisphosphate aldolase family protein [Synergistaceae bacterium]